MFVYRNAVKQEQTLIQDAAGFSSNLQELVSDVKENKAQFQQLVDRVQSLAENTQRDSDKNIQARQSQIDGKRFLKIVFRINIWKH